MIVHQQSKTSKRPMITVSQYQNPTLFIWIRRKFFVNGAGKTTLISVLTGFYDASSGSAWIDGRQVGTEEANTCLGVCPQFDLLWEQLTISQHLYFYALLKGVKFDQLQEKISQLLKDVDLLQERDLQSCELSGGMRRRLSLAITLIGNPRVVILDQPSSGLDPSHRRQMCDILLSNVFLTENAKREQQSFQEHILWRNLKHFAIELESSIKDYFDVLGLKNSQKKNSKKGIYRLTVNFKEWKGQRAGVLSTLLESGCELVNDLQSRIKVEVAKENMLECVKKLRRFDSLHWLLSQPSLYEVFMHFIS